MVGLSEGGMNRRGFGRPSHWAGPSGRTYGLTPESLDHFVMHDESLYLIARGGHVLWVGSTAELVADPLSRSRFRLAMSCADRIFRVQPPSDAGARLSTIFDLEAAAPMQERSAA